MALVRSMTKDVGVLPAVGMPATLSPNGTGARPAGAPALPAMNGHSPFEPARNPQTGSSVIGTDLTILGERLTIISQNRLQIDGDIRGDVSGKQVTIGAEGSVIGTVSAEKIEVYGGVNGAIRAGSVLLHASSKVEGEILHQSLNITEGAQFDGRVRRSKDEAELIPNLDPATYNIGDQPPQP